MPPEFNGEVPLVLSGGRTLTLTFNHETLFAAEKAYGEALHILLGHLQMDRWGAVRAFLFAGLQPKHPEITLCECGEMLLGGELEAIGKSIASGLDAAMPKGGKEGENPPARAPRGKSSGASGAKPGSSRKRSGKQPRARSR